MTELGVLLPPNTSTHELTYDAYMAVQDCLVEHGYPVSQPPSLDTFIENPNTWTPWEGWFVGAGAPD